MKQTKFVVYTVLVGEYDKVLQPKVVDERFAYILFTDNVTSDRIGVWEVRTFDYHNIDKTRESRYPKMHPELLLPEYEASLYIDANISIADKVIYERVISFYEQGVNWAGILHPHNPSRGLYCRYGIYGHAFWAMSFGVDNEKSIFKLCSMLRKEGYPRNREMHENNVIYRKKDEVCRQIDELWWKLYCNYSRRDQLTLEYALWKHPEVQLGLMLPKGERAFDTSAFDTCLHTSSASRTRFVKKSVFEYIRDRIRNSMPDKRDRFEDFHYWLYGLPPLASRFVLFLWMIILQKEKL